MQAKKIELAHNLTKIFWMIFSNYVYVLYFNVGHFTDFPPFTGRGKVDSWGFSLTLTEYTEHTHTQIVKTHTHPNTLQHPNTYTHTLTLTHTQKHRNRQIVNKQSNFLAEYQLS